MFFSLLSVASASDTTDNVTITAVSDDSNTISVTNNQDHNLGASPGFTSLNTTISDSQAGESITLNEDYSYSDSDGDFSEGIIIDKSITIDGQGNTINAQKKASIFNIQGNSKVILKDIIFSNAFGVNGSAIKLDPSTHLEIINCKFNDNVAQMSGGAIYVSNSSSLTSNLIINGSEFNRNSARFGGALYLTENSHELSIIENSKFIKCTSTGDGGAAYISADNVELKSVVFQDNVAGDDGGAVYWEGNNGIIIDIACTNNKGNSSGTSNTRGGSIIITGSNITVSNSKFSKGSSYANRNNTTRVDGGALFVTGNDVTIKNTTFDQCSAVNNGGAVYVIGNNAEIIECTFTKNTGSDGAALFINGTGCKLINSTFNGNTANDDGAIFWQGDNGYMYNITCVNNKGVSQGSNSRGGTICLTGNNVTVAKSRFTSSVATIDAGKNSSKVDGGALFVTGNDVIIIDTTFDKCTAANNGGALYVIGNNTEIINNTFTNNKGLDGAALFVNGTDCKLINSTFKDNIANDDGAIFWNGDNGYMYNITCNNNKGISEGNSSTRGGTICLTGDNVTVVKSSFTKSQANIGKDKDASKVDGGAIFITGNDVNILETSFYECSAAHDGGALYIIGNDTQVVNCYIYKSSASDGGALFINGSRINLLNSSTVQNSAENGGAIYIEGHDVVISELQSSSNNANTRGGSIYVEGYGAYIDKSTFTSNTGLIGGAIYIAGDDVVVDNSSFKSNNGKGKTTADGGSGGAIYIDGEGATISNSDFDSGYAVRYGGAIAVWGANANITSNEFKDCSVNEFDGGAIFVKGVNATISKSNFSGDTSKVGNGGAIGVEGDDAHILDCNFTACKATSSSSRGGAIDIQGHRTIVDNSIFKECYSPNGGDIYVFGNNVKMQNSLFDSNTAVKGGAIFVWGWGAVIENSNFTNCNASESGGAIYTTQSGGTNIVNDNFDSCAAIGTSSSNGGGAIYVEGPDTHIASSNFTNNRANLGSARGGTIFIKGEGIFLEKSQFNNSIAHQGGIIHIEGGNAIINASTFSNSSSKSVGGAISVVGSNAVIEWSHFENFKAGGNGGAIYVDGKDTSVLHSSFDNCTVGNANGGVIFIKNVGTTVAFSNFTNSKAGIAGAIYIDGENTTISYCNLEKNTANSAGAIKVSGNDTMISNSNFTDNIAKSGSGGALDMSGDNASVYYSFFDENRAYSNGGAINWDGGHGSDSIVGCTFTNNDCNNTQQGGGAIFWTAGEIGHIGAGGLIQDSKFINNTANGRHGGAINWYHAKDSVINNCLFINNTAASDGGALYTGHQTGGGFNLTMTNCQFYNNTAHKHGGAIANQMEGSWIYNNTFDGNKAQASGGSIVMKESFAINSVIDHCYIYNSYVNQSYDDNRYGEGGGAIRIDDDNITITNCAIFNSVANSTYGGAIYVKSVNASLINISIENTATLNDNGGAIYWAGNNGYMENATIFNSSSNSLGKKDANGGAIYLSGINCNFTKITITSSSSNNPNNGSTKSAHGGAIYVAGGNNVGTNNVVSNIIIDNATSSSDNFKSDGGAIYWAGKSGSLINATISNTLANGKGGAIFWSGSSDIVENISIDYSRTNVMNSSNTADGGAIYSTGINNLNNVYVADAIAYTDNGNVKGGAIYYTGANMNNVTVLMSRASTDNGTSYGGAIYLDGRVNPNLYNSSFEENHADLGGAVYTVRTTKVYDTSFTGNVAEDGGALYATSNDVTLNGTSFESNSAKRGGAIFTNNVQIKMYNSTIKNNTAEESGAALYHNYVNKAANSEIVNTDMVNNTAYRGSAIYATDFVRFSLKDVVLLDNQANANKFINKTIGVYNDTYNYTSAIFLGNDNLLNSIWLQGNRLDLSCTNVTYLGTNGISVTNETPVKSNQEVRQNVTIYMFDKKGELIDQQDLVTDGSGKVVYTFKAEKGEIYNFAYEHKSDRYYTYLRDTSSNSSLVQIWVNNCTYGENASALLSLTDGAWGNLSGNVTVEINDTKHTTFTVEIINSTLTYYNISGLPVGHYKATSTFKGNSTRLGDTDWALFVVRPYTDLNITKEVNVTGDFVNVTDYIMYTINVTNKGPTESWDVNVTEILTPYLKLINSTASKGYYNYTNGTWFIGDLAVNENVSLIIKAQVIHKGLIANNVWVDGAGREANFTDNVASARNLTAVAYVDLRIAKERNVSEVLAIGDRIRYVITVFNDGPCNATGVYVGENLDARLKLISSVASVGKYENGTWNIGDLNEGANATLTIDAEVRYAGVIINKVNVTTYDNDTNLTNNFANVTNLAVANVDLQITKKANVSGTVAVGDRIKFTVSVYNDGPCNATGVFVGEEIKHPLKFISANVTIGRYQDATWVIGNLNKGEVHNLTIIAEVVASGDISNYVFVNGSDNDTNLTNNEYNLTNITAASFVDLVIDKEVTRADVVYVNDTVVFTIRVHNRGDLDATDVNVTEFWNSHLKVEESTTQNGYYNETERIWYIGTLAKKSDATLTIKARVMSNGTISNVVVVKSREKDINESNNRDEIDNFTALPIVDLDIHKRAITIPARDTVYVGDEITFAIDVHNSGPCTATGVVVSENVTGLVEIISINPSVGTSYDPIKGIWTIGTLESGGNAGLFITVKVKSNGTVANFVSVKGNEKDTNTSNNNASSDNITALPLVDVKVNKTVSATEVKVGDNMVYTIKVQNNGPNDATNVNVTGKLSNNVVYISSAASQGSYDAAKNIWYIGKLTNSSIATMTLTVQAVEVGTVENSVIVNSTEKDRNTSNNNYACDNVTVTKLDTPIELVTYNITYGEDEILVVRLPEKVTGTVNITVADRTYNNVPINNGIVELPVTDLAGGDYDVTVVYGGDDKYLPNSTSGKFNVAKLTPKITIQVEDIWVWEIEVLNVTVNAPGTVFVTVNGITVEIPLENGVVTTDVLKASKFDYNGRATWNIINLPVGTYPAYAMYPGNENYTSVDTSDVFHVKDRIPTTIVIIPSNIYVGDDEFMEIYVGPSGVTGSVIVNVEGVNYTCPLENGYALLAIPDLKAGVKDVTAWYNGNELYLPSENISSFEVWKIKPPVDVEAPEITVGEDGVIIVTVPDDATGEITIEINGERHTAIIQFGQAVFIIPGLEVGVHDILAFYSGDDKYLPANTTGKIKVNPKDEPDDDNKTHKHPSKKSTIDNKMPATGNPLMALIVVLMSIFLVQVRRFKK
ncbi:Ig-like domain repeat protein [uncultured Methanobrevibacter sp.]|uniref:Ig-like domain repeat protein n=1 Tax=uncultured Methanobrevibacter sp. TaxID=253161 RepID=UPI0026367035|nr:Ig-like domain repeat protein [uncultured Methanobrevibacter sp.]